MKKVFLLSFLFPLVFHAANESQVASVEAINDWIGNRSQQDSLEHIYELASGDEFKGLYVRWVDSEGKPLMLSSERGLGEIGLVKAVETMDFLMGSGIDIDSKALVKGMRSYGSKGVIFDLHINSSVITEWRTSYGETLLHSALGLREGLWTIEFLISSGIGVEVKSPELKRTPLILAAAVVDAKAVELLLQLGANPRARAANEFTALHIISTFSDRPRNIENVLKIISLLVEAEPELLNMEAPGGFNALSLTALAGRRIPEEMKVIAERLLAMGGAPNPRQDKEFFTRFFILAGEMGSTEVARVVLEWGKNYGMDKVLNHGIKTSNSVTPSHIAAKHGNIGTLEAYIEYGADMTQTNKSGKDIREFAAFHNQMEVVEYLENRGASKGSPCAAYNLIR